MSNEHSNQTKSIQYVTTFHHHFQNKNSCFMTYTVLQKYRHTRKSILPTQGPIHEILAVIAQLLGAVENFSFFESAILNFFFKKNNFYFALFQSKLVIIYWIARIFQNFDDYPDFQKNQGGV